MKRIRNWSITFSRRFQLGVEHTIMTCIGPSDAIQGVVLHLTRGVVLVFPPSRTWKFAKPQQIRIVV